MNQAIEQSTSSAGAISLKHKVGLGVLFVVSYAGFLHYFWQTDQHRVISDDAPANIAAATTAASNQTEDVAISQTHSDRIAPHAEEKPKSTPPAASNAVSVSKHVAEIVERISDAKPPMERAKAIVELGNATKTPESVAVLVRVLNADPAPRNRLFAVNALKLLALREPDETIHAALRGAQQDADSRVATVAKTALATLGKNDT